MDSKANFIISSKANFTKNKKILLVLYKKPSKNVIYSVTLFLWLNKFRMRKT